MTYMSYLGFLKSYFLQKWRKIKEQRWLER
nr:MAG TPA: amino acid transporter [Caudoviricetes sp.]DAW42088.1 MAG TPA: amino acid transporter [Caudoviricetes sp.]